ncbi:FLYWCH-type zinc finger-containing protein 1 [Aphis craccivora]|uniref:FLYWCH-type zinc finger-containing protein 1 n=1 Tax=Aphis craccivora TaxID=307492 RepID=A0A6G0YAU5_APHCR|nr:FLYWCH-type zinc finger-containing protein 1 [Aphis craccivora]
MLGQTSVLVIGQLPIIKSLTRTIQRTRVIKKYAPVIQMTSLVTELLNLFPRYFPRYHVNFLMSNIYHIRPGRCLSSTYSETLNKSLQVAVALSSEIA